MDKALHKLRKKVGNFLPTDKNSKSAIIIGSIIGVFISCSPYFFYLYESVPLSQTWKTTFFTYDSQGWGDANFAMWVLTGKILPLIFLVIWFFTNKHWWYHSLLVPIAMYVYQIMGFFSDETKFIDEFQLMYMVPVMAIIIPSIYLIRARMFSQLNDADKSFEQLEQEFMIKPTTFWGKVKQYF
jgi:hypothetical protein